MIKMPKFLQSKIQSDAYTNKNNPDYSETNEDVSKYLQTLYPGQIEFDATGRMQEPDYDMTEEQFEDAQSQIDSDFEDEKDEAEGETMDEYGEYFDNLGISFNIEDYVVAGESIAVNVLQDDGSIEVKHLETYDLEIPDFENINTIWVWHSDQSDHICDECADLDGETFFDEDNVPECPAHPNRNCWVEEIEVDGRGNRVKSSKYAGTTKVENKEEKMKEKLDPKNMKISEKGLDLLKHLEGDVKVNGRHVIYDDKTGLSVKSGEALPKGATIGYGHLIRPGEDFSKGLTEAQATDLFRQDLQSTYRTIERQINPDALASMSQNQYDALVSFVFNIGPGNASSENANRGLFQSTVRQYLNNESDYVSPVYPTLEDAWRAFRNGGTLDKRRDAEWRLFQNADYSGYR
ncbi:MAG: lysozyme [Proteobacteria bacterium]|nr:lysozyme [Pseudomonadota bacterium]